jgi:hypothetical protein
MFIRDRTTSALVTAIALIGLIGYARPGIDKRQCSDEQASSTFAEKLTWRAEYDLVVIGDSRVVFGVSPAVIDQILAVDGHRTANFGFLGVTLREDYLDWGARLLCPPRPGRERTILIGVTPRALVPTVTWTDQFSESVHLGFLGSRLAARVKPLLIPYRGTTLSEIRGYFRPRAGSKLPVEFAWQEDGSILAKRMASGSGDGNMIRPPDEPVDPFEPTTERALLDRVRGWTRRGIRVFAFRPPVPPEMAAQEDRVYRFDEASFIGGFTSAGGTWLEADIADLDCWDGSHLAASSALELSRKLGQQIARSRSVRNR